MSIAVVSAACCSAQGTNHANPLFTSPQVNSSGVDFFFGALNINHGAWSSSSIVRDNKSNTWNPRTVASSTNRDVIPCWCQPTSVGTLHDFGSANTFGNEYPSVGILALSGVKITSPYDTEDTKTTNSGTSLNPSVTVAAAGSIAILALTCDNGGSAVCAGYTLLARFDINAGPEAVGGAFFYKLNVGAGTESPTVSWTGTTQGAASLTIFKPESAGAAAFGPECHLPVSQPQAMNFNPSIVMN